MTSTAPVAVLGAGIAGLSAARVLAGRGREVVVVDKGRGPGGRASSRRATPFAFDHGAQYLTARDPRFLAELEGWLAAGVAAPWDGRIAVLEPGAAPRERPGTTRYVGTPHMSAIARHLARDLDVRCGLRVERLEHGGAGWYLRLATDGEVGPGDCAALGPFGQLVLTAPPAQAAALLGEAHPLGPGVAGVTLTPCWAAMVALEAPYDVPFDGAFCGGEVLSWAARDSSKPGRPEGEAWVLHATAAWSEAHRGRPRPGIAAALAGELAALCGAPLPGIVHADAHFWGFAQPASEVPVPLPHDPATGLVLAGDGYAGGRVEGAWLAGLEAAALLDGPADPGPGAP